MSTISLRQQSRLREQPPRRLRLKQRSRLTKHQVRSSKMEQTLKRQRAVMIRLSKRLELRGETTREDTLREAAVSTVDAVDGEVEASTSTIEVECRATTTEIREEMETTIGHSIQGDLRARTELKMELLLRMEEKTSTPLVESVVAIVADTIDMTESTEEDVAVVEADSADRLREKLARMVRLSKARSLEVVE